MSEGGVPPAIEPAGVFEGLRPRAILLGAIVDHFATIVSGLLLVAFFQAGGDPQDSRDPAEGLEALAGSAEFLLASLVVGVLCTVLGGYMGARRAGCLFVRHGAWVAVVSALVGLLLYAAAGQEHTNPLWFDLLGFSLLIPAGATGGLLARFQYPGQEHRP